MDPGAQLERDRSAAVREILPIEMDAFHAPVEQLDDPSLRGRPVLVGGVSRRSVAADAFHQACPYGARSEMPMLAPRRPPRL